MLTVTTIIKMVEEVGRVTPKKGSLLGSVVGLISAETRQRQIMSRTSCKRGAERRAVLKNSVCVWRHSVSFLHSFSASRRHAMPLPFDARICLTCYQHRTKISEIHQMVDICSVFTFCVGYLTRFNKFAFGSLSKVQHLFFVCNLLMYSGWSDVTNLHFYHRRSLPFLA